MTALIRSVILLSLAGAGLGACAQRRLSPTYGLLYRNTFGTQLAERSTRPTAPMSGDEGKRIIGSYLDSLGGGGAPAPAGPSPGGSAGGGGLSLKGR